MKLQFASIQPPALIQQSDWESWIWQMQNRIQTQSDFEKYFALSSEEKKAFADGEKIFNIRTTPYYTQLINPNDEHDPIRKIITPHFSELSAGQQALLDPLGEKKNNPVPRIIHRYPDRILFLITDVCSVYCRFCTRKHFTGQEQAFLSPKELEVALDYIRKHTGVREIILSGGDPLTVSDFQLEKVLSALRKIEHIEIIRIGSRMPVVCPMRMTEGLAKMIRKYKPVVLMTHFNHPRELTEQSAYAIETMVDHGIPVFNQMVLLNGVNNHPAIVQALSRRLLFLRAKPYYMFQCDPSEGTDHLRTTIENSMEIQKELWGYLSGLAMPNLSLDIPEGGGKTYLVPNFEISRGENFREYQGFDGVKAQYKNPNSQNIKIPSDTENYMKEWQALKAAKL